jgi:hypothetical protein
MLPTRIKLSLAAIAILGLVIPLALQRQHLRRLRAENAALRQQAAELAALQASHERPANQPSDAEAAARSQRDRQELVRLRGEMARLRNGLAQSTPREPAVQSNTSSGQPGTNDQSVPLRCTATVTATVHAGDTFATGGWLTAPGTRTFFLATPSLVAGDSGTRMIDIPTIFLKMPEADLPDALMKKIDAQPAGASPVLTGNELEVLMAALKSGQGSNVVSRSRITTNDEGEANLMVGQTSEVLKNPDGTPVFTGTELRMLPKIKNGEMIEVGVNLNYDVPSDALDEDATPPGQ